jgi:hypothetical protein
MSEARRFMAWFKHEKRERDLFDAKFYPGDVSQVDAEAFFKEVNRVLALRANLNFVKRSDLY